jgi:N-acetylmuramoyl-L-alanine amidase
MTWGWIFEEGYRFLFTMSSKSFFIYLVVMLCVLLSSFDLFAAGTHIEQQSPTIKRYDQAKAYYKQLQTTSNLSAARENWLQGASNFRRIYLSSPKSDLAAACLFMLGRIYGDMYDRFQDKDDLDESISYFKDTARLFPRHRLADDAYFSLAQIYAEKLNSPHKSADILEVIVTDYPHADMRPMAEDLLKLQSKEYDIPLPPTLVSSSSSNNLSYVLPVKYWSSEDYTRVVIMASGPVQYNDVLLEETKNSQRRLYIDFKKSYIEPQYRSPVPIEDGLLRSIRTGQFSPDTVRVVLDLESIGNYKIFTLPDPFRVVIDVRGKGQKTAITQPIALAATKKKRQGKTAIAQNTDIVTLRDTKKLVYSTSSSEKEAAIDNLPGDIELSLAQQLGLGVKKIIIDPGHGGKDPGAMAFGMKEKDIVLDIAKKLAPVLEKELHCQVVLTRDKDIFIPLEERTAIANTENADLFVSLHINAHPSGKIRGLETYYLNLTSNAEAMRVAARENATSTHQMSDLQGILSDIMKNSKISESSRLAQQVHNSILTKANNNDYANIKNLGVKQAPFYVLIGAEMPAILIEIAFISNEQDAKNLKNPSFVAMLTQEIAYGIRAYVTDTTAQLSFIEK